MTPVRHRFSIVPAAMAMALVACGLQPVLLLDDRHPAPTPPILLKRCDQAHDLLCVLTFGLEPPDQMFILLLASPGLPETLETVAVQGGSKFSYACASTDAGSTLSCRGPLLPLGSHLRLEVYSRQPPALLAGGEFDLTALALPTMPAGGSALATPPPSVTARPTRTPLDTMTVAAAPSQ